MFPPIQKTSSMHILLIERIDKMLRLELLNQFLVIAMALSVITTLFIQKTKRLFRSNRIIPIYGLIVNISLAILFSITFTQVTFPESIWIGFFAFLGAESIYQILNRTLASHSDLVDTDYLKIPKENLIERDVNK